LKRLIIKDIANHFSVSISTVSKALNDSYEISVETKKKIQKFARENNYKPNFNAISLKNRRTKTIGIIIPNMLNYYFAQVFKGIEKTAAKNGYKIITCISNQSHQKETETMEMLSNGSIDGFIMSIAKETELLNNFEHIQNTINQEIPVVLFDRVTDKIECDKVITNNIESAYNTVQYLYNNGNKHIAFVSTMSNLTIGKQRFEGYKKGLENVGIPFDKNLVINIQEKDYKKHEAVLDHILDTHKIDSVITTGESTAVSAMKAAIKKGYKIPKDFSVVAFSNGILARHSSPKMTTVSQHGELMGETAAKILIDRLEKKSTGFVTKIIKTDLVVRKSTRTV